MASSTPWRRSGTRSTLVEAMHQADRFDTLTQEGRITIESGDAAVAREFLDALDVFTTPALIEP